MMIATIEKLSHDAERVVSEREMRDVSCAELPPVAGHGRRGTHVGTRPRSRAAPLRQEAVKQRL